jgi:tetratricopeptide (TPR) repeat protein
MGLLPGGALPACLDRLWGEESWRELMDTLVRYSLIERREMGEMEYFSAFPFVTAYAEKLLTEDDRRAFVKKILRYYAELSDVIYDNLFEEEGESVRFLFSLLEANFRACVHPKRIEKYPNPSDLQQPLEQISYRFPDVFKFTGRAEDGIIFAKILFHSCKIAQTIRGEANTLKSLGDLRVRVDDLEGARADYERALPIYQEIRDRLGEANTLKSLGNLLRAEEKYDDAVESLMKAVEIHLSIPDIFSVAGDLGYLERTLNAHQKYPSAIIICEMALSIFKTVKDYWGQALILKDQGDAFSGMENQRAECAAKWQALQILQKIQPQSATGRNLAQFFQSLEQETEPSEYQSLISELEQNAETLRQAAVAEVYKSHGEDAFVKKIMGMVAGV